MELSLALRSWVELEVACTCSFYASITSSLTVHMFRGFKFAQMEMSEL